MKQDIEDNQAMIEAIDDRDLFETAMDTLSEETKRNTILS